MYLRQTNKWNEWLLQEAVEDIGLPPAVAHFLRQQDEAFGPVENKHLTWIGQLVKEQRQDLLLSREQLMEIRLHLKQAVRVTLQKLGDAFNTHVLDEPINIWPKVLLGGFVGFALNLIEGSAVKLHSDHRLDTSPFPTAK